MDALPTTCKDVSATVVEVLPGLGLAWVEDARHTTWAVTRSTPGVTLEALTPGSQVHLTIQDIDGQAIAVACH